MSAVSIAELRRVAPRAARALVKAAATGQLEPQLRNTKRRRAARRSAAAARTFLRLCRAKGLPAPAAEHRFDPARQSRFDFAWPAAKVALEVEGGIWRAGGGAHSHPANIVRDLEKYNRATLQGWRIYRVPPERLASPKTFAAIGALLEARPRAGAWLGELAEWLARGPRPHEPPRGSRSVYGWLKMRGEQIVAEFHAPFRGA